MSKNVEFGQTKLVAQFVSKLQVPDRASSEGCAIRQVEIPSNKLLTTSPGMVDDPLRAQDAMYLHLVYNRKRIQMTGKGDFT